MGRCYGGPWWIFGGGKSADLEVDVARRRRTPQLQAHEVYIIQR